MTQRRGRHGKSESRSLKIHPNASSSARTPSSRTRNTATPNLLTEHKESKNDLALSDRLSLILLERSSERNRRAHRENHEQAYHRNRSQIGISFVFERGFYSSERFVRAKSRLRYSSRKILARTCSPPHTASDHRQRHLALCETHPLPASSGARNWSDQLILCERAQRAAYIRIARTCLPTWSDAVIIRPIYRVYPKPIRCTGTGPFWFGCDVMRATVLFLSLSLTLVCVCVCLGRFSMWPQFNDRQYGYL